jgi:hypothetical protein
MPAATRSNAASRPPRTHLAPSEVESLNAVCSWLPSLSAEPSTPLLGDLVVTSLETGQPQPRGRTAIGSPGGLAAAASEASDLLAALATIEPSDSSVVAGFAACRAARAAHDALVERGKDVRDSFFSQLAAGEHGASPLAAALNELLALFKPAPWAYQEIMLRAQMRGAQSGGEKETLGFVSDNLPAELRLNTAEMNSFTLALFLLCAPALPNPLRLLVLDDPLQNMDEMTVSSLARGLGKLIRIYPVGWRIAALFHAEEDLHRVRDEVPCAVYRLPWLNPAGTSEKPITAEPDESTWRREPQTLEALMAAAI